MIIIIFETQVSSFLINRSKYSIESNFKQLFNEILNSSTLSLFLFRSTIKLSTRLY